MILNQESFIKEKEQWENKGYQIPKYNRALIKKNTQENPIWIHFGAGNIFRAFHANIAQKLLNEGDIDKGIIVAEGYDYEIIEKINRPNDDYFIRIILKTDNSIEKNVTGSVVESCILDSEKKGEFARLQKIFASPSLQMTTFTITEKGYCLFDSTGKYLDAVEKDFHLGPAAPKSYIGKVSSLLYHRYQKGAYPIAMVSTDNCSHNGEALYQAVSAFAEKWEEAGLAEKGFVNYINNKEKVSFPWSMIDKITPRPDKSVEKILEKDGIEYAAPIVTKKNTYAALFVNAEESEYLVIEDAFPNGRPPLEHAGVIFTDRETVDKVEKMKVCTCLNPLHTALAVYGCLLGYEKISDEMKDGDLRKMAEIIGYREGLPVVVNPGVIEPEKFIDTVLNVRLPNPFMPDTPQRIATDTSQKLSIRFGETIKRYLAEKRELEELKIIPLVFAGWLRYLMGVNDDGEPFMLSPDPLLGMLSPYISSFKIGEIPPDSQIEEKLRGLLKNEKIWGIDLYQAGLAQKVCHYFGELAAAKNSVRNTLKRYVRE